MITFSAFLEDVDNFLSDVSFPSYHHFKFHISLFPVRICFIQNLPKKVLAYIVRKTLRNQYLAAFIFFKHKEALFTIEITTMIAYLQQYY